MKKFLFLVLVTTCINVKAQITLDTIAASQYGIGYGFYTVQLSPTETKYLFSDTVTNSFSLFNMDFTPFMTNITLPEPIVTNNGSFYTVLYVSRSLFDCDSTNIEYAYSAPTNGFKTFYVMRTDGTELFHLDSANGPYCAGGCLSYSDVIRPVRNTSDGAKLFLQRPYNFFGFKFWIYSLCGTLLEEVFDFTQSHQSYVTVYPNPSSTTLNFEINLPDNMHEYYLLIMDSEAKEVKREELNSRNNKYTMNISDMNNGTYLYSLCTKFKSYQTGKFILTK